MPSVAPSVAPSALLPLRAAAGASLLLAPLLVWQGRQVRRTVPALPDAAGPTKGETGMMAAGPGAAPLDLLVLGESTAAGMGAPTHDDALAGAVARALAAASARAVRWQVRARSGATAHAARALVDDDATPVLRADVVVVALGVNDVLRFHSDWTWTRALDALVARLRARCGAVPVVVAAVPPMHCFPALPQPLRWALGARARLLDAAAARWAARTPGVAHAPASTLDVVADRGFFAADGFHPSPAGYRVWGEALGAVAAAMLATDARERARRSA
jgi:lysophospholipase L1-like esterase